MSLRIVTPPAVEPVTASDMDAFLRIDQTYEDALVGSLASAARAWCEDYTQRKFLTQTWKLGLDFFPGYVDMRLAGSKVSSPFVSGSNAVMVGIRYAIALPYPPVQSIEVFTYQDGNGNPVTMNANTDYILDTDSEPARLTPPFGMLWPVARVIINAIEVTYTCGMGDTAAELPAGILLAIKLLAANWYENRVPDDQNIPMAVKALLGPYRDFRI